MGTRRRARRSPFAASSQYLIERPTGLRAEVAFKAASESGQTAIPNPEGVAISDPVASPTISTSSDTIGAPINPNEAASVDLPAPVWPRKTTAPAGVENALAWRTRRPM